MNFALNYSFTSMRAATWCMRHRKQLLLLRSSQLNAKSKSEVKFCCSVWTHAILSLPQAHFFKVSKTKFDNHCYVRYLNEHNVIARYSFLYKDWKAVLNSQWCSQYAFFFPLLGRNIQGRVTCRAGLYAWKYGTLQDKPCLITWQE